MCVCRVVLRGRCLVGLTFIDTSVFPLVGTKTVSSIEIVRPIELITVAKNSNALSVPLSVLPSTRIGSSVLVFHGPHCYTHTMGFVGSQQQHIARIFTGIAVRIGNET